MAALQAVELVFVASATPCAEHDPCACSYVLVDVHTSSPIFEDPLVLPAATLDRTAAALETTGGMDRLVVFFVVFLRQRGDRDGLSFERKHAYVHFEFAAWGHEKMPLGGGCGCALCGEVGQGRLEDTCGREVLAQLPVEFLSGCMVEMLRRAAQWVLRYDFLRAADLELWRDTFRRDIVKPGQRSVGIDFLAESGVSCVRPAAERAMVYCTLPVFARVATEGHAPCAGGFHLHAMRRSAMTVRVCADMHRHMSLLAPKAIRLHVFAKAPSDPAVSLAGQLAVLGNRPPPVTLRVTSEDRVDDAAVPALQPHRQACIVPARFLGPGPHRDRRKLPTGVDCLAILCPVPVMLRSGPPPPPGAEASWRA